MIIFIITEWFPSQTYLILIVTCTQTKPPAHNCTTFTNTNKGNIEHFKEKKKKQKTKKK